MMAEAEAALRSATRAARPGRFQTEAAIQSLHAQSRITGERLHAPLAQLYDALARFAPTTGVLVARAVALAENGQPDAARRQGRNCRRDKQHNGAEDDEQADEIEAHLGRDRL